MIKYLTYIFIILISLISFFGNANNIPLKYIYGCEIDLDKDGKLDMAIVIENSNGQELIVLLRKKTGYKSYLLSEKFDNMELSCKYGYTLLETKSGSFEGRKFKTNGTYLLLTQPEGPEVAFFWDGKKFQEVWLTD